MRRSSAACKDLGLTISLKETDVMMQGSEAKPPYISINDYQLENVDQFTYL